MNEFMKLLEKKKKEGKTLDGDKMSSKMKVLKELRGIADEELGKDIPSLKKIAVASPTKEGLEEGLEKASDIVEEAPLPDEESDEDEEPYAADGSEEYKQACEMAKMLSPEEKAKLIEELK